MKELLVKLDTVLEEYLVKKAPPLDAKVKKILVQLAPWFAVVGALLGIPAILAAFGVAAIVTPFAYVAGAESGAFWFFWIVGLAQVILAAMAINPLFAHKERGWQLLFYSQLLSVVASLWHINLGSLLVAALSFYLLYQIKSSYK